MSEIRDELSSELRLNSCELRRSRRKTIGITVLPDGRISIAAPYYASKLFIEEILHKKAGWIRDRRQFYRQCVWLNRPYQYIKDERHLYLGRWHKLIWNSPAAENYISLDIGGEPSPLKVKKELENWYKREAINYFHKRLEHLLSRFKHNKRGEVSVKTRFMRALWGSCSTSGSISVNTHLIKTPPACIDYVLMHEICHLAEMNHSPRYYELLNNYMPDWKKRDQLLKRFICR